jgi:hypothetical protein
MASADAIDDGLSAEHILLTGQLRRRRDARPWGALLLALLLLSIGVVSLTMFTMISVGVLDERWAENAQPLLIVGLLGFLPGAYETRIAYAAWRGWPGYSFEQIPRYDD